MIVVAEIDMSRKTETSKNEDWSCSNTCHYHKTLDKMIKFKRMIESLKFLLRLSKSECLLYLQTPSNTIHEVLLGVPPLLLSRRVTQKGDITLKQGCLSRKPSVVLVTYEGIYLSHTRYWWFLRQYPCRARNKDRAFRGWLFMSKSKVG